ncbi:MAG: hypothetical protein Tsb009_37130 [Planctomycetaceae bacterium]
MQAQLIPLDGGETVEITHDITVVGRKEELCDLIIEHGSISKLHCVIVKTDGLLFIRDLASTNGTKVNGQRVSRGALLPGDELSFAKIRYRVHMGPTPQKEVSLDSPTEMLTSLPDPQHENDEVNVEIPPNSAPVRPIIENPQHDSESDVRLLPDDSVA